MELQDIKSNWDTLSKRVDKLEIENKSLLKEITKNKLKSSLDRMKQTEQRLLWVSVCCLIYIDFIGFMGFLTVATTILFSVVLILTIVWQLYRINFLKGMNLLNPPIELLSKLKRYKIESRYRFYAGLVIAFIIIFLVGIFEQNSLPATTMKAVYIGAGIGLIIGLIIDKLYSKQLNSLISEMKEITEASK